MPKSRNMLVINVTTELTRMSRTRGRRRDMANQLVPYIIILSVLPERLSRPRQRVNKYPLGEIHHLLGHQNMESISFKVRSGRGDTAEQLFTVSFNSYSKSLVMTGPNVSKLSNIWQLELPSLLIQPLFVAIICFEMVSAGPSHDHCRVGEALDLPRALERSIFDEIWTLLKWGVPRIQLIWPSSWFPEIVVYLPMADTPRLIFRKLYTSQVIPFLDPDGAT